MHKVSRRGGFSDRNGIKPENVEIQLKNFDERTRVQIFNLICEVYEVIYGDVYYDDEIVQDFFRYVYAEIYAQPVNIVEDYDEEDVFDDIGETLTDDEYDSILTLVEAIAQYWACDLKSFEIGPMSRFSTS